jgi:hypothetical protein
MMKIVKFGKSGIGRAFDSLYFRWWMGNEGYRQFKELNKQYHARQQARLLKGDK